MTLSAKVKRAINASIIEHEDITHLRKTIGGIMNIDKTLDQVHSIYIRLKNSCEAGTTQCVTCRKWFQFNEIHLGHFIKRRHIRFRWFEPNTSPQCDECNSKEESGNLIEPMRDYKVSTLGHEAVEQMERDIHKPFKMTKTEKDTLLRTRRLQCRDLLKDKNFNVQIP